MSRPTADVIVVGGGIIGCATAYYLSRSGLEVHLVEKDGIATGTSGGCMGHLMVTPGPPDSYALTRASVLLWQQLAEEIGDFEYNPTGALWLAENEEDLPLLDKLVAELESHGDRGERLDGRELREREPALAEDLPGAMYYPDDGIVMPMKAAGAMLAAAVSSGCVVSTMTPVTGLLLENGVVAGVRTAAGEIHAPHVVNAAGVWSPGLFDGLDLPRPPIYPRRGDLAITMHHTTPVRTQMLEVAYLRVSMGGAGASPTSAEPDPGVQAVNLQPQTNGTCLVGSTRQFQGTDLSRPVNRELLRRSLDRAARYVPAFAAAPVARTWAGLRPYTIDKKPIIGPVVQLPGLHMAAGHEGLGITLAPVTGQLVTQALRGEETALDLGPYRFERFAEVSA